MENFRSVDLGFLSPETVWNENLIEIIGYSICVACQFFQLLYLLTFFRTFRRNWFIQMKGVLLLNLRFCYFLSKFYFVSLRINIYRNKIKTKNTNLPKSETNLKSFSTSTASSIVSCHHGVFFSGLLKFDSTSNENISPGIQAGDKTWWSGKIWENEKWNDRNGKLIVFGDARGLSFFCYPKRCHTTGNGAPTRGPSTESERLVIGAVVIVFADHQCELIDFAENHTFRCNKLILWQQ